MPRARNGNVEIYYEVRGEPDDPVLMLVPGLGEQIGSVEFPPEQVDRFLKAGFRVVRLDCRDAGLSTSFESAGRPDVGAVLTALMSGEAPSVPYTHFDMADDLIAVADDLEADVVHLVGASAGGFVVRWAAIRHPARIATVTVVMSGSGASFDDDGPQMDLTGFDALLAEADHRPAAEQIDHMVELWRGLWATSFRFDESWITETVTRAVHRSYRPDGLLRQLVAAMGTAGLWEAQRSIAQPVLVVHGSDDSDFAPDHAAGIARQAQNANVWLVEGMGHSMPAEIWDDMAQRISTLAGVS